MAEVEGSTVNLFCPDEEFFVIKSDGLGSVKSRLYGFSVMEDGNIVTNAEYSGSGGGRS